MEAAVAFSRKKFLYREELRCSIRVTKVILRSHTLSINDFVRLVSIVFLRQCVCVSERAREFSVLQSTG